MTELTELVGFRQEAYSQKHSLHCGRDGRHQRQGVGREACLGESHPHCAGNDASHDDVTGICDDDDDIMQSTQSRMLRIKYNMLMIL